MKRFIISVLCVSVFFIGLGGIVEKTSASFRSDARALELIRLARVAIGGDANINNVRSMTIKGNSAHVININGAAESKQGSMEINFELPGKFSKMFRVGEAGENTDVQKQVDVMVMEKIDRTAETRDLGDGRKVVTVRDGDGKILTENIRPADAPRRIIIKKDDGTVLTENIVGGDAASESMTTESGKKVLIDKDVRIVRPGESGTRRHNEMLRTTLALLLTAPEGTQIDYTYAGETSIDGATCNIVEANANGSVFKLYLDKTTNLPKMISYLGAPMNVVKVDRPISTDGVPQKDVKVFVRKLESGETVEHQVKFSDFRSVGGLLLPHKWTETVAGNAGETVDVTNYEINPAGIADKFKNEKVFIRTEKAQ